ncbi:MAG: hypothetical protein Wins2KO_03090 [Winogradskyella sp.]
MVIHATAMYAWYGLVVIQAGFIQRKSFFRHQRLGYFSVAIALAVLVTGIMITVYGFKHSESMLFFSGNSLMLIFFTIFYTLAILFRKQGDTHKRLILFASIAVYIPVAFRTAAILGDRKYASAVYLILILITAIWEIRTLRKISITTLLCTVSLIAMVILTFVLANNHAFTLFVHEMFEVTIKE